MTRRSGSLQANADATGEGAAFRVVGASLSGVALLLASCSEASHTGTGPVDAARHDEAALARDGSADVARTTGTDASVADVVVEASPSADVVSDAGPVDAGPLAACAPVPASPECDAGLRIDFMCAVTEADSLASLGCNAKDVVASAEVLACCPPCAGTDGGGCYQSGSP